MHYSWDKRKNAENVRKHGISFERAVRIFDGPTIEKIDDRYDYGETRISTIGLIEGVEIFVVYAEKREGERRVISARKAERKERAEFWRQITSPHG